MAMQAAAKGQAKRERGEGPVAFGYVDVSGKDDYKRVPLNVKSVVVTDNKTKQRKSYDVSALPANVKDALVAFAFSTRAKTYLNNHLGEDDKISPLSLTDNVYNDFASGKVYAKAEGAGPRGRVFDTALYVEAFRLTMSLMAEKGIKRKTDNQAYKPLSKDGIAKLTAKFDGMTGKEKTEYVAKLKKTNGYFASFVKELEAAKLKKAVTEDDEIGDMF